MRSDKNKKNKKTDRRVVLGILLAVFLLFGMGAGYYASSVGQFFNEISDSNSGKTDEEIARQNLLLEEKQPFSVLLLGTDLEDQGSGTRTDTVMVATINPEQENVKIVSIPRDVPITLESGFTEKVNAMYQIGGVDLLKDVLGDMFDIPISFYAMMDFQGLIELVDAVGGITVDSEFEFTVQDSEENSDAIQIDEGIQNLNGEEALGYARMRKQDPRGDFGRQDRQQEVIRSIIDELMSLNTVTNFTRILNAIGPYMSTDATSQQMLVIAANYLRSAQNMETLTLEGEEGREYFPHYGFSVYVYDLYDESVEEVSTEFQEHLGIDPREELPEEDPYGEDDSSGEFDQYEEESEEYVVPEPHPEDLPEGYEPPEAETFEEPAPPEQEAPGVYEEPTSEFDQPATYEEEPEPSQGESGIYDTYGQEPYNSETNEGTGY